MCVCVAFAGDVKGFCASSVVYEMASRNWKYRWRMGGIIRWFAKGKCMNDEEK